MKQTLTLLTIVAAIIVGSVGAAAVGSGIAAQPMSDRSTYDLRVSGLTIGADGELCTEPVDDGVVRITGEDVSFDDLEITLVGGTDHDTTVEAERIDVASGEEIHIYAAEGNALIDALADVEEFAGIGCVPGTGLVDLPVPLPLEMEVYKIESSEQSLDGMRVSHRNADG